MTKKNAKLLYWSWIICLILYGTAPLIAREKILVENRTDTTFLKHLLKDGAILRDVEINTQISTILSNTFLDWKHDETAFKGNVVKLELLGNISSFIGFHFTLSFNNRTNLNTSLDGVNTTITNACVMWAPFKKIKFTIGKQDLQMGGHEYNAKVLNVPMYSDLEDALPFHAVGVNTEYLFNKNQFICFQITNSRERSEENTFSNGLPQGVESAKVPLRFSLFWEGKFLNEALTLQYSVGMAELAKNKKQLYLIGGNTWKKGPILTYLDVTYARSSIDYEGFISDLQTLPLRTSTAQNVEYFTVVADFDYWLSKRWKVFVKGDWGFSNIYKSSGCVENNNDFEAGRYMNSWMAQACIEYYPIRNMSEFHIYLNFTHKQYQMTELARKLGAEDYSKQYILLGFVYTVPVL